MTINISGFGSKANLIADATFPAGVILSQFSDDQDWVDPESLKVAGAAMGGNGDLLLWTEPHEINVSLSLIADGDDDQLMQILLNANRGARGKIVTNDVVTLSIIFPLGRFAGRTFTYTAGGILEGIPGTGVAAGKRKKTKVYKFAFEDMTSN